MLVNKGVRKALLALSAMLIFIMFILVVMDKQAVGYKDFGFDNFYTGNVGDEGDPKAAYDAMNASSDIGAQACDAVLKRVGAYDENLYTALCGRYSWISTHDAPVSTSESGNGTSLDSYYTDTSGSVIQPYKDGDYIIAPTASIFRNSNVDQSLVSYGEGICMEITAGASFVIRWEDISSWYCHIGKENPNKHTTVCGYGGVNLKTVGGMVLGVAKASTKVTIWKADGDGNLTKATWADFYFPMNGSKGVVDVVAYETDTFSNQMSNEVTVLSKRAAANRIVEVKHVTKAQTVDDESNANSEYKANEYDIAVVVMGNGVTAQANDENLWQSNHGMAATDFKKDYYHRVIENLQREYKRVYNNAIDLTKWEVASNRNSILNSYNAYLSSDVGLVIIQCGENITDFTTFAVDFAALVQHVRLRSPGARIIIVGSCIKDSKNVDDVKRFVANTMGASFVPTNIFNKEPLKYFSRTGTIISKNSGGTFLIKDNRTASYLNDEGHKYLAESIETVMKSGTIIDSDGYNKNGSINIVFYGNSVTHNIPTSVYPADRGMASSAEGKDYSSIVIEWLKRAFRQVNVQYKSISEWENPNGASRSSRLSIFDAGLSMKPELFILQFGENIVPNQPIDKEEITEMLAYVKKVSPETVVVVVQSSFENTDGVRDAQKTALAESDCLFAETLDIRQDKESLCSYIGSIVDSNGEPFPITNLGVAEYPNDTGHAKIAESVIAAISKSDYNAKSIEQAKQPTHGLPQETTSQITNYNFKYDNVKVNIPNVKGRYRIAWVSDLHIVADTRMPSEFAAGSDNMNKVQKRYDMFLDTTGTVHSMDLLNPLIEELNGGKYDAVIFGGDMIDYCSEANISLLKDALGKVKIPYIYIRSDHDYGFKSEYGIDENTSGRSRQASLPDGNNNSNKIIRLGNEFVIAGLNDSWLDSNDLSRISDIANDSLPVLLATHVPFESIVDSSKSGLVNFSNAVKGRVYFWNTIGSANVHKLENAPNLKSFLNKYVYGESSIKFVGAGHMHGNISNLNWTGTINGSRQEHVFTAAHLGYIGIIEIN